MKDSYAIKFLRATIFNQKIYLLTYILTGIGSAIFEGLTITLLFLVVKLFATQSISSINFFSFKILGLEPSQFLSEMSFKQVFITFLLITLIVQLLQFIFSYVYLVSSKYIEAKCLSEITYLIHKKILDLKFPIANSFKIGDLSDQINQCPNTIRVVIENYTKITLSALLSISYLIVLLNLSFKLLLLVLIILFSVRLLSTKLYPKIRKISEEVTKSQVEINEQILENLQGLKVIHISGIVNQINYNLRLKLLAFEKILQKRSYRLSLIAPLFNLIPILTIIIISLLSIVQSFTISFESALPILVTFFISLQRLNIRVVSISQSFSALEDINSRIKRIDNLLKINENEKFRKGGIELKNKINKIQFSKVYFSYDKQVRALDDMNFTINNGEHISIVGHSGAGKSTIVELLTALYYPDYGKILINDIPTDKINLDDFYNRIAFVNQSPFLFNNSIFYNITLGINDFTQNEFDRACKLSQADKFIKQLPYQYETIIGERGSNLSGGQRQRIVLARALLKKSEILILDEATSALDSQNENLIQSKIKEIKENRIIISIAHRFSTVKDSDKILVLNKGKIVESGDHNTLIRNNFVYKKLYEEQIE